jgi:hypothetical protein
MRQDYRLYIYDQQGHLVGPPLTISAVDDEAAIDHATTHRDGRRAELLAGGRLVKRFSSQAVAT